MWKWGLYLKYLICNTFETHTQIKKKWYVVFYICFWPAEGMWTILSDFLLMRLIYLYRMGHSQIHSKRPTLQWYQKQRNYKRRNLPTNISDEYRYKNHQNLLANRFQQYIKRTTHHKKVRFIARGQELFNS